MREVGATAFRRDACMHIWEDIVYDKHSERFSNLIIGEINEHHLFYSSIQTFLTQSKKSLESRNNKRLNLFATQQCTKAN